MTHTYRPILTIVLLTSLLTACGFHLRGQVVGGNNNSGVKALAVFGGSAAYLRDLSRAIKQNGINVTEQAPWQLRVLHLEEETDRQTTARASEQRVALKVVYQLQTSEGLALFAPVTLTKERFLNKHEETTNAREAEQKIDLAELRQELITETLRRLSRLSDADLIKEAKEARQRQKAQRRAQEQQNRNAAP